MTNITVHIDGCRYYRVTKTVALRKYLCGKNIIAVPCKLNPANVWGNYSVISNPNKVGDKENFEKVLNAIKYYNCNNETGHYLSYYIRSEE